MLSNPAPWHPPAPAGGGKRSLVRVSKSLAVTSSQFREVALLEGAIGSCRWGLHYATCILEHIPACGIILRPSLQ